MMASPFFYHNDVWMTSLALLWLFYHQPDEKDSLGMAER